MFLNLRPSVVVIALGAVSLNIPATHAVTLFQVDDFSVDTSGWVEGNATPNAPEVLDTGLAGGAYLSNAASGSGGPGGRMVMWNDSQWTGDFIGGGVTAIEFEALSTGADPIDFRFGFNGPGGWFTTPAIRIDDFTSEPALGSFSLGLGAGDLTYVSGGTNSYAATMGAVTRLEIFSATGAPSTGVSPSVLRGDLVNGVLLVDNIRAVPEPGTIGLFSIGIAALVLRRKRRTR